MGAADRATGYWCDLAPVSSGFGNSGYRQYCELYDVRVFPVEDTDEAALVLAQADTRHLGETFPVFLDEFGGEVADLDDVVGPEGCRGIRDDDGGDHLLGSGVAEQLSGCDLYSLRPAAEGYRAVAADAALEGSTMTDSIVFIEHRWRLLETHVPCDREFFDCDPWLSAPVMP